MATDTPAPVSEPKNEIGLTADEMKLAQNQSPEIQALLQKLIEQGQQGTSGGTPQPIGMSPYAVKVDPKTGKATYDTSRPNFATRPVNLPSPWDVGQNIGRSLGMTEAIAPQYFEGEEWALISNMPPEKLGELQDKMIKLKLYSSPKPNIVRKNPDADTVNAYKIVLAAANNTGKTPDEVLDQMTTNAIGQAQSSPTTPHAIRISTPTELAAAFRQAGLQTLGRAPKDDEVARMVTAYQALERQAQTQAFAATDEGAVGNTDVYTAPSAEAFAAAQLKAAHPNEFERNNLLGAVSEFRKILAGPPLPTKGAG